MSSCWAHSSSFILSLQITAIEEKNRCTDNFNELKEKEKSVRLNLMNLDSSINSFENKVNVFMLKHVRCPRKNPLDPTKVSFLEDSVFRWKV